MNGWIGVDLDGTLAEYHGWPADGSIGKPIPAMVERVKRWLAEGRDIRIFTARVWPMGTASAFAPTTDGGARLEQALFQYKQIRDWTLKHLGAALDVTCVKDYSMVTFWDDRAIQVEPNTGRRVDGVE